MKRLLMTAENRALVRAGRKTQTRRLRKGLSARFKVADLVGLPEPFLRFPDASIIYRDDAPDMKATWISPRFMPDARVREIVRITEVRLERLNAISEADARAEGCADVAAYRQLWERIHGAGAWERNPEVWVITFARVVA